MTAPKTRKEAYARQKELAKAQRAARRTPTSQLTVAQRRELLRAGDPSVLPRRDQGPTKKLARDYVDSHRMFSNYLLLLFPLIVVGYVVPVPAARRAGGVPRPARRVVHRRAAGSARLAVERNGKADGSNFGIGFYAGSRAYIPRRWRLPAPQVQRGDPI